MVSRRPVFWRSPAAFADAVADDNQYDMGGSVWHGDRHRRRRVKRIAGLTVRNDACRDRHFFPGFCSECC